MDEGTNDKGYRWVVEDQRSIGRGFRTTLWREGETEPRAGRQGFKTREAAVEYARTYEGGRFAAVPIIVAGLGIALLFGIMALTVRALWRGEANVHVHTGFGFGMPSFGRRVVVPSRGAWARPMPRGR